VSNKTQVVSCVNSSESRTGRKTSTFSISLWARSPFRTPATIITQMKNKRKAIRQGEAICPLRQTIGKNPAKKKSENPNKSTLARTSTNRSMQKASVSHATTATVEPSSPTTASTGISPTMPLACARTATSASLLERSGKRSA